ncbi:hypothetical protein LCGC14_2261360 [marine sediment metagenome]|uniref:Uncharacterized protein n=1 Tax=marine sediment metagenome TaxID=412755 RepID=A0A0F9FUN5_9ZZZZ
MVKEHVYGLADLFRKRFESIIARVGINTYTIYSISETRNSMGRISTRTESSTTISGFLHKVTPQDKQFLELGVLEVGDGIFFAEEDVSINENDEIAESGETKRWILTLK